MKINQADLIPILIVPALMLIGFLAIGSLSTWLTLTIAGLAMGMIIYTIASGLTVVFGLMDVLNFGHGVFITLGAYLAVSIFAGMHGFLLSPDILRNLLAIGAAIALAVVGTAIAGAIFERLLVKPVYGDHLMQILVTMGGLIVGEELIKVVWGVEQVNVPIPAFLKGVFAYGDFAVEKFRVYAFAVGLIAFLGQMYVFSQTKTGLLIRASVHDREMVEALGYGVRRLFVGTFIAGCALAGLGGVMWGMYQQTLVPQIGSQMTVLIFIVVIIGGLGSTWGALLGSILVGIVANYAGFLAPTFALFSNIAIMTAVLLWRPQGLYGAAAR